MNKLLFTLVTVFVSSLAMGQTTTENYIHTTNYQIKTTSGSVSDNDKIENITYFDGLGRAKQQIGIKNSSNQKDVVTFIIYDEFGRQNKQYLPFEQQNGVVRSFNAVNISSDINTYYKNKYPDDFSGVNLNDVNAYSESVFEAAPLNRVIEQAAPGKDWKSARESALTINESWPSSDFAIVGSTLYPSNPPVDFTIDEEGQMNCVFNMIGLGSGFKFILGNIKFLSDDLPDTDLGYLFDTFFGVTTSYYISIKNGFLHIASPNQETVKIINTTFTHQFNFDNSGGGKTIKFEYGSNLVSEVKLYEVNLSFANNTYTPTLIGGSYYNAGDLYKTITKDENWTPNQTYSHDHTIEEFKNKQGQVILKRTYNNNIGHDTYYVYDKFGNLTYVLPPKSEPQTAKPDTTEMSELCYQYIYDYSNRLIEKKIPGKDWEYIIYDNLDRPVLTQDAKLRTENNWMFTKYDVFGRVVYTGLFTTSETKTSLRTLFKNKTTAIANYEEKVNSGTGFQNSYYSNDDFPNTGLELHTINYYDNYVFDKAGLTLPTSTVFTQAVTQGGIQTKGLATGSKVRVLETTQFITSLVGYNDKGQVIYTASDNVYLDTKDEVQTELDFVGKVLRARSRHQRGSDDEIVTLDAYSYDHMGRLIDQFQCIGDDTLLNDCSGSSNLPVTIIRNATLTTTENLEATTSITLQPGFHIIASSSLSFTAQITPSSGELIAKNHYDELGQLDQKKVGNNTTSPLQTVDYTYNIRGWLKGINNEGGSNASITLGAGDLFGFQINYNTPNTGVALFNGNISQTLWKTTSVNNTSNPVSHQYTYSYDALNRIKGAIDNTTDTRYSLSNIDYDKNGNITLLNRKGHTNVDATTFGTMDNLTYIYDSGNKLLSVTDAISTPALMEGEFKDGNKVGNDYTYDVNGNMISDANKGITSITYNHLNLPVHISINGSGNNGTIDYIYDATGTKMRKTVSAGATTDYAGNFIYEGSVGNIQLQFFNHPEGYITPDGQGGYDYVYQYKDHLGNIRLSYTKDPSNSGQPTIIEENNYYPFGLQHQGYNSNINGVENNYQTFNGKEYEKSLDLNWHDFGARNYDASLGRWMNVDPMADKYYSYSPYAYTANNPIYFIDPDGKQIDISYIYKQDEDGKDVLDKNGNRILTGVNITITGKLINFSDNDVDMAGALSEINSYLEETYSGTFNGVEVKTTANFTSAESMEDVSESDHLLVLSESGKKNPDASGAANSFGPGKVAFLDADYFTGWFDANFGKTGERTAIHELGHNLGLKHSREGGNIMVSGGSGNSFTFSQLGTIIQNYEESNQALNYGADGLPNMGVLQYQGIFNMTNTQGRDKKVNKTEYFKKIMKIKK